jgi:hypothetical protein
VGRLGWRRHHQPELFDAVGGRLHLRGLGKQNTRQEHHHDQRQTHFSGAGAILVGIILHSVSIVSTSTCPEVSGGVPRRRRWCHCVPSFHAVVNSDFPSKTERGAVEWYGPGLGVPPAEKYTCPGYCPSAL